MESMGRLSPLQVAVAEIFFGLDEAAGFLVAGGDALVASDLIARPTEDIDLFTAAPTTSVSAASQALVGALGSMALVWSLSRTGRRSAGWLSPGRGRRRWSTWPRTRRRTGRQR